VAKKPFVNPLTRSSEEDLHLPQLEQTTEIKPQIVEQQPTKKQTFEDTHERFTGWLRKDLKKQLNDLAKKEGNKTGLLNEAVELLLRKKDRKPYTKKQENQDL
jgi:DNA relaxase NicK